MKTSTTNTDRSKKGMPWIPTFLMVFSMILLSQSGNTQTIYKTALGSQIKVSGTSNLHDWEMLATNFYCVGNFSSKGGAFDDISTLSFILPISNLKSKEDLMDTRAYKAMNAKDYPKMNFKLTNATVTHDQKAIIATGSLTIAGITKAIVIQSTYVVNPDESITIKGSKSIKMSDFNIKAPSFMLGALKTGDDLVIDLLLRFKK